MQIFAEFDSHAALLREFENNLGKARAFVLGEFDVTERQAVELVLIHPATGEWLPLKAEVVYIAAPGPAAVGLEILDFTSERLAHLQSFVTSVPEEPISLVSLESVERDRFELAEATPQVDVEIALQPPLAQKETRTSSHFLDAPTESRMPSHFPSPTEGEQGHEPEEMETEYDEFDEEPAAPSSGSAPGSKRSIPPPKNVQERVRKLNIREREAMARGGTLTERVALERAYGAVVWDGLLANAALTGPEVARIAKNGNATLPHLTLIVNNAAWLAKGEVRRALLTNPRLTPPQIEKVLRALPPAELKQLPKQTAYAPKVRAVAMRMLSR